MEHDEHQHTNDEEHDHHHDHPEGSKWWTAMVGFVLLGLLLLGIYLAITYD